MHLSFRQFEFLNADVLREWKYEFWEANARPPGLLSIDLWPGFPLYQHLKAACPEVFKKERIKLTDAWGKQRAHKVLTISHPWDEDSIPDKHGEQMQTLLDFLCEEHGEKFELVWVDVCCLPQNSTSELLPAGLKRTPCEESYFSKALLKVDLLYLSCSVLAMINMSCEFTCPLDGVGRGLNAPPACFHDDATLCVCRCH